MRAVAIQSPGEGLISSKEREYVSSVERPTDMTQFIWHFRRCHGKAV